MQGGERVGDGRLAIEHTFAPDFARVGGDHRRDEAALQQRQDLLPCDALRRQGVDRAGHAVRPGLTAAPPLGGVLGDVGDLQEAGEGMGEANRVGEAEAPQALGQPPSGLG